VGDCSAVGRARLLNRDSARHLLREALGAWVLVAIRSPAAWTAHDAQSAARPQLLRGLGWGLNARSGGSSPIRVHVDDQTDPPGPNACAFDPRCSLAGLWLRLALFTLTSLGTSRS
jgi:hypothetical protein